LPPGMVYRSKTELALEAIDQVSVPMINVGGMPT
jgi:hypothetical protein